mgnify:CR=1 FL=1
MGPGYGMHPSMVAAQHMSHQQQHMMAQQPRMPRPGSMSQYGSHLMVSVRSVCLCVSVCLRHLSRSMVLTDLKFIIVLLFCMVVEK